MDIQDNLGHVFSSRFKIHSYTPGMYRSIRLKFADFRVIWLFRFVCERGGGMDLRINNDFMKDLNTFHHLTPNKTNYCTRADCRRGINTA